MPNKLIKIIGLEYSGTTLTDLLVSSLNENYISLGEVERSVGREHAHKQFVCACGRPNCEYWEHRSLEYPFFLKNLLLNASVVDSSKTRSSLLLYLPPNSIVLFLYKDCMSWCISCLSRYFILEVKPWRSCSPWKYLVPFIRIEILRRLIILLPFEWLLRNIILLLYAKNLSESAGCVFCSIPLGNLLRYYDGLKIQLSNNHILRGNKISRAKQISISSNPNNQNLLNFLAIFDLFFAAFTTKNMTNLGFLFNK